MMIDLILDDKNANEMYKLFPIDIDINYEEDSNGKTVDISICSEITRTKLYELFHYDSKVMNNMIRELFHCVEFGNFNKYGDVILNHIVENQMTKDDLIYTIKTDIQESIGIYKDDITDIYRELFNIYKMNVFEKLYHSNYPMSYQRIRNVSTIYCIKNYKEFMNEEGKTK